MAVTVEKKNTKRFSFEMREGEIVFDEGFAATEGATVSTVEVAPACGRVTRLSMAVGLLFSLSLILKRHAHRALKWKHLIIIINNVVIVIVVIVGKRRSRHRHRLAGWVGCSENERLDRVFVPFFL